MSVLCLLRTCLLAFATLAATGQSHAQMVFNSRISGPGGPTSGLFEWRNGTVVPLVTGLASNDFPSLAPDGRTVLLSSPDPARPQDVSWDLFAFDRVTGARRMLFDNVTQSQNGGYMYSMPMFTATSSDGQLVAMVNQHAITQTLPPGDGAGDGFRQLMVISAAGGELIASAELGIGSQIDFLESEFLGVSWWPLGPLFATPAYVPVTTNLGRQTYAAGIVLFGPGGPYGFQRYQALTQPSVTEIYGQAIITRTHAFPAFSPDARRMAFYQITHPSVTLTEPVSVELFIADMTGEGGATRLATFQPGIFPLGLAWASDGRQLVMSLSNQVQSGPTFLPAGDPDTAVLRTIDGVTGGSPGQIPGAPMGYFPQPLPATLFRTGFE